MHRYTNIDSIECSYENVKVAFGAGEVVIFYFPFATMYLKKKKILVLDNGMTLNRETNFDEVNVLYKSYKGWLWASSLSDH